MSETSPEPGVGQETTAEPEGQQQQPLDYETLSEEQADNLLQQQYGEDRLPEQMLAPEPAPEPEQEATETVEEQPAEQQAEAQPEPVPAPEAPAQPTDSELESTELRLRLEQTENARQRQEFLTGRFSGQVGRLQQQIASLQSQIAGQRQPEVDGYDPPPLAPPQAPQQQVSADQSRLAELEADQRNRAVAEEFQAFTQRLSQQLVADGVDAQEVPARAEAVLAEMAPAIKEAVTPYTDMELNPRSAQKVTRLVLDAAHQEWQLGQIRNLRARARERQVAQTQQVVEAKQAATISGSGAAPAPKPRQKTVEEMTAEEADKELMRQFGDGRARLRP